MPATTGKINGHEWVDLGLSVKWATCNVGASSPSEYGGYYAWGETEKKTDYSKQTYKWRKGAADAKYCIDSKDGTVDNKTTLEPEDDVARVKWGSGWRMPTSSEIAELIEGCTWNWTTQNGVNGYKVTGSNGNSIFLPAAGYRIGSEVGNRGSIGIYWSGTLSESYRYYAYHLYFNRGSWFWDDNYRYDGNTVRPVTE